MWPWEHVVVGYLVFSLSSRALYRRPPGDWAAVAVAVGSVLPDLVDKPLAWQFGVVETGYALAHSGFVAVPVAVAVWAHAWRRGRGSVGAGFAVGYLAHPPADVITYYLRRGSWHPERVLWPVRTAEAAGTGPPGLAEGTLVYLLPYLAELLSGSPGPYMLGVLSLGAAAVALWVLDGVPGIAPVLDALSARRGRRGN